MKRAISVILLVLAASLLLYSDPQVSRTQALTTGTAVRVATTPTTANSLFIQMKTGGSAVGYVLWAPPDQTCALATAGHLVAELAPASASGPGGSFSWSSASGANPNGFSVQHFCVAGTTGDSVIISYNVRN